MAWAGALAGPALTGARTLATEIVPSAPRNLRLDTGSTTTTTTTGSSGASPAKPLLAQSDFAYLGAFRLPRDVNGGDGAWGRTLTHRYVDGELRLMSMSLNHNVYEVRCPTLAPGSYPEAQIARTWGDVSLGKRWTDRYGLNSGFVFGLYWDSVDSRLYWNYGDTYNTTDPDDPSVGYSLLDDATGTVSPKGVWRFWPNRGCKATMGGVVPIPDWFSDAYCRGQRLGAGFGGYWSIVSVGPAHMGPALAAFAPPDLAVTADRSNIPFTSLVGYPYNATAYTTPDRCHRNTDYTTEFDGWNPKNGIGYWSWSDWLWQSGVWIDTPSKSALIFFPTLGQGRTWYQTSTLHAERASHAWMLYSTADLGTVARGATDQWKIQPAATWNVQYPNLTYPLGGWADEPWNMVTGATYDSTANRLYIAVRFAYGTGSYSQHVVYVYQVAA